MVPGTGAGGSPKGRDDPGDGTTGAGGSGAGRDDPGDEGA